MIRRRELLLAGLLPLAACSAREKAPATVSGEDDGFHGTALTDGYPMPAESLTNQHGQPWSLAASPETPVLLLFFGYTNCPDVCPGILADMATARRRLEADQAAKVTLVMVTTDPARDTPDVLKEYLGRIDESFIGLTGDLDQIVRMGEQLGVGIEEGTQLPSGGYEVDHSTQVMGVGADRRVQVVWTTGYQVAEMREDLALLIARN